MSLKFYKVFLTSLFLFVFSTFLFAQEMTTSADVMRERISKAKAYLVVKNYNAAIYELENIKRETNDSTVNRVLNVLLMHSYLEQGNYKKAQDFLKELHNSKKPNAAMDYFATAGQVVSGAKTQLERYKALGLSVSDRNLPLEASTDVESMRQTLELVVEQSRALSKNKEFSNNAFALLEETSVARVNLAKDDYDSKRWKDQVSDAREQMVGSRSIIINAAGERSVIEEKSNAPSTKTIALADLQESNIPEVTDKEIENKEVGDNIFELKPVTKTSKPAPKKQNKIENTVIEVPKKEVADTNTEKVESEPKEVEKTDEPVRKTIIVGANSKKTEEKTAAEKEEKKPETPAKVEKILEDNVADTNDTNLDDEGRLTVGSLLIYAIRRVNPVYPRTARSMRLTGVVKVEVMIDEDGEVAKVENAEGPAMLKRAAEDAIRKWKFKPFVRDGQPVKATGFVNFNFSL